MSEKVKELQVTSNEFNRVWQGFGAQVLRNKGINIEDFETYRFFVPAEIGSMDLSLDRMTIVKGVSLS